MLCKTCNNEIKKYGKIYCSIQCCSKDSEHQIKKSLKMKGIMPKNLSLINANKKGAGNPMYGKKESPEHIKSRTASLIGREVSAEQRKKSSETHKRRVVDGLHNSYKGGVTPENRRIRHGIDFRLWREAVFARDNWTCQKCSERGGALHPHHIQNFAEWPELRFAIDNGVTLCSICHKAFHKKYGLRKNNKEQIEEYLNEKFI